MVLYIGDRIDEQFVGEIAKNITEELQMITDVHTMEGIINTLHTIPNRLVIINVISIQEYPEELVKQLKYIQCNLQSNLIIIARGQDSSDPFIQSLYFAGIKNVILTTWIPTVVSQCLKYITGMYPETSLLYINEEGNLPVINPQIASDDNQTTKLNLSQVFENDPDILLQLSEDEQTEPKTEKITTELPQEQDRSTGTVKLSNEQLYMSGADLYAQVKQYESVPDLEQSTILYNEAMEEEQQPPLFEQPQVFEQSQYVQQGYVSPDKIQFNNNQFQQNRNAGMPVSSYYNNPVQEVRKKGKKSKKSIIVTICLCAILLVSILVPVCFTLMQKMDEEKKESPEYFTYATNNAALDASNEPAPSQTPEVEIVTGAMEEGADEIITATPQTTQEPVFTLTPIIEETKVPTVQPTKEPTRTPTQKPTPKVTQKPTTTPKPVSTPKPTKEPTPKPTQKSTPKPTVAPIKIKKLVLPQSIRMIKGTSTDIEISYSPSNATEAIKWSSSNTSVATVKNGIITAKKVGTVTVTATTSGGIKKTIQVVIGNE
ncbi:MAG: Ig-like domain-containing protein [bacterium]|nr:Ig-like domain-containing protein [bacterium]